MNRYFDPVLREFVTVSPPMTQGSIKPSPPFRQKFVTAVMARRQMRVLGGGAPGAVENPPMQNGAVENQLRRVEQGRRCGESVGAQRDGGAFPKMGKTERERLALSKGNSGKRGIGRGAEWENGRPEGLVSARASKKNIVRPQTRDSVVAKAEWVASRWRRAGRV